MKDMPKIVLTGGPAGGKTTAIKIMQRQKNYHIIPEAATLILENGYPPITADRPWTPTWQQGLQLAVMGLQKGLEKLAEETASSSRAIICDRGLVDNVAYLNDKELYEQLSGESQEESLLRYDAVFFLHTYALNRLYGKDTNSSRFESAEEAIDINERLYEAWRGHSNIVEIDHPNLNTRCQQILGKIEEIIN